MFHFICSTVGKARNNVSHIGIVITARVVISSWANPRRVAMYIGHTWASWA